MYLVINEIKTFQRQLTADHNEWSANLHPTRIASLAGPQIACAARGWFFSIRRKFMAHLVVYFDHLPIKIQCIWNIHSLAQHQITKRTRHTGLAVTRRTIHKDGSTRIKRRTQTLKGGFRENQLRQELAHRS